MRKTIHKLKWLLAVLLPLFLLLGCSPGVANKKQIKKSVAKISPEQKLELVSYKTKSVARSGDNEDEKGFWIFGERKMLVTFKAEFIAGLDLKDFNPRKDIKLNKRAKSAWIRLPEPVILSCEVPFGDINNDYEKVGALRSSFKPEEVVDVAMQGKETILKEIKDYKRYPILDDAKANARRTFTSLFNSLGYDEVEIVFASPEEQKKTKVKSQEKAVGASGPEEPAETEEDDEIEAVG